MISQNIITTNWSKSIYQVFIIQDINFYFVFMIFEENKYCPLVREDIWFDWSVIIDYRKFSVILTRTAKSTVSEQFKIIITHKKTQKQVFERLFNK